MRGQTGSSWFIGSLFVLVACVVAPLAAALPWVIRIEAEPRVEPDSAPT